MNKGRSYMASLTRLCKFPCLVLLMLHTVTTCGYMCCTMHADRACIKAHLCGSPLLLAAPPL